MDLRLYNIELIDGNTILYHDTLIEWADSIYHHSMIDGIKASKNKLLYHFIIKNVCNAILSVKGRGNKVIFATLPEYYPNISKETLSCIGYTLDEYMKIIKRIIYQIERILPIKFYMSRYYYDKFNEIMQRSDGKSMFLLQKIRHKCENKDFTKFTFEKAKRFAKKYDLQWLNNIYFNDFKTKQLVI